MIDGNVFGESMNKLARRFGREVDDDIIAEYYEFLSRQLSTEEFRKAAYIVFHYDKWWPEPARFLEAAGVDPNSQAEAAWQGVLSDARNGVIRPLSQYDEPTRAGLERAGTPHAIGQANESAMPYIRKRFLAGYRAHVTTSGGPPGLEKPDTPEIEGLL